jgi:hypothetical protein
VRPELKRECVTESNDAANQSASEERNRDSTMRIGALRALLATSPG